MDYATSYFRAMTAAQSKRHQEQGKGEAELLRLAIEAEGPVRDRASAYLLRKYASGNLALTDEHGVTRRWSEASGRVELVPATVGNADRQRRGLIVIVR